MRTTEAQFIEVFFACTALVVMLTLGFSLRKQRTWVGVSMFGSAGFVTLATLPALQSPLSSLVDSTRLMQVAIAAVIWGAMSIVGLILVLRNRPLLCGSLSLLVLMFAIGAEWMVVPQWNVSRNIFVNGPVANPVVLSDSAPQTAPPSRFNILLLGGDAGPGRWGVRTDAIHLVSIDASMSPKDGAVVISIPRNLLNAPLPSALKDKFPNGFDRLVNGLFGWGEAHPADVERAVGATDEPGASLVASMVADFTGLRVDGWILTDMRGFMNLVDSAGGVEIWVDKYIHAPGSAFGGVTPARDFAPGWQTFNGADALSFVRARKQDTDYHRMARQRCVLASLAAQMSARKLVVHWPRIASTLAENVRTNLSPDEFVQLRGMSGLRERDIKVLSLVPPYVNNDSWNLEEVRTLVHNAVYGTRNPVVLPGSNTVVTSGETSVGSDPRWTCKVTKTG